MRTLVLRLLLPLSCLLLLAAGVEARSPRPLTREQQKLLDTVVSHYAPAVRTLSREILVYHWTRQAGARIHDGDTRTRVPSAADHLRQQLEEALDPESMRDQVGPGLYAAIDPVASISFGAGSHPDWALYEIPLEKGARLLDLELVPSLPPELANPLSPPDGPCPSGVTASPSSIFESGCGRLRTELIRRLDLAGIIYLYSASTGRHCESRRNVAMNLVNPAIARGDWKVLTRFHPPAVPRRELDFRGRIANLLVAFDGKRHLQSTGLENFLGNSAELNGELGKTIREKMFGCSDYPEDAGVRSLVRKDLTQAEIAELARSRDEATRLLSALSETKRITVPLERIRWEPPDIVEVRNPASARAETIQVIQRILDPESSLARVCAAQEKLAAKVMACAHCLRDPGLSLSGVDEAVCRILVHADLDPLGVEAFFREPGLDTLARSLAALDGSGAPGSRRREALRALGELAVKTLPRSELSLERWAQLPDSLAQIPSLLEPIYRKHGLEPPERRLSEFLVTDPTQLKADFINSARRSELERWKKRASCLREFQGKATAAAKPPPCGLRADGEPR